MLVDDQAENERSQDCVANHRSGETVILLHGIGANRLYMTMLARRMKRKGYNVINWGYFSYFASIESHGERLHEEITRLNAEPECESIHVVAHSMGTIVTRSALTHSCPSKLKRVVLLAPPNQGTPVARVFSPLVGWFCKPAIELSNDETSWVNQLPNDLGVPCGIIAAAMDWIVPSSSTRLGTEKEHITIPTIHSMLVFRKDVVDRIDLFLQTGGFFGEGEDSQVRSGAA